MYRAAYHPCTDCRCSISSFVIAFTGDMSFNAMQICREDTSLLGFIFFVPATLLLLPRPSDYRVGETSAASLTNLRISSLLSLVVIKALLISRSLLPPRLHMSRTHCRISSCPPQIESTSSRWQSLRALGNAMSGAIDATIIHLLKWGPTVTDLDTSLMM